MTALEREGGWMWQTEVVDEVDLSSSTVSRHLSSLEEDDEVQRVRIRREKVVGLPDSDLEVFQSPYESDR
ncbi:winged helix-turn-helix domain-containing protein [Halorubellus litoreus]|uniref:Helix-turn-helix transcriptional regulator n=2 Tax=Halorubellus litoreus TaxID=755308 RepID=A0ABD5VMD2_9EURY